MIIFQQQKTPVYFKQLIYRLNIIYSVVHGYQKNCVPRKPPIKRSHAIT